MRPGVHQHDGDGADAVGEGGTQRITGGGLVERLDLAAIHRDPAADLGDAFVQQFGQAHIEVEQPRPRLVADAQHVGEAAVDDQQHAFALALQQRVGGDGGAHLHRIDQPFGHRGARGEAQRLADAGHRRVAIPFRVLGQQFAGRQAALGVARDDIGEGAATIDPELPAAHAIIP